MLLQLIFNTHGAASKTGELGARLPPGNEPEVEAESGSSSEDDGGAGGEAVAAWLPQVPAGRMDSPL